jgi:arsenite methyltransferase
MRMRYGMLVISALCIAAVALGQNSEGPLKKGFEDPPSAARPRVWWHWMNGNITRDGAKEDMDWMKRVGPTGKAYGLDMTDDMLALARESQKQAGVTNVEFLKGEIENIPLPDSPVDVIISNCVINLSANKDRVLHEAFRVLKPGGRFAVSDVVVRGSVPEAVRESMLLWVGCIAGALEEDDYIAKLTGAGFEDAAVEPTRVYNVEDARKFLIEAGVDVDAIAPQVNEKFFSAFVRAIKPLKSEEGSCCSPGCCSTGSEREKG